MIRNGEYDRRGFWFVAGAVAERTAVSGNDGKRVTVSVEASVESGDVLNLQLDDGFDCVRFVPTPHPSYIPPSSYEGMTGGGVWVGYVADGKGATSEGSRLNFVGVNFWQSDVGGQGRSIVCHGPDGVYGRLNEAVREKFE